jgi:2,4-dienoyl-CoA reductase-like NADH-dependent reductase (Old Yellow Enzyme family)
MTPSGSLFEPGRLGPHTTRNRLVRAGTSESMGDHHGNATPKQAALYEELARSGLAVITTGHMFCHPRGQYTRRQTGIHADHVVPSLRTLTEAVHRHGGLAVAQLAHAGSQSRLRDNRPLAPSPVPNALTGRPVDEGTPEEIEEVVAAFGAGARRAMESGFDGVHLHGANGYLISEFSSPVTNRREDGWGGSAEKRDRFALEVVRAVRAQLPDSMSLTMKLGMVDAVPGGLDLGETIPRAQRLVAAGLDGIEVSSNVMQLATDSAKQYVAVDRRRALQDLLLHRLHKGPAPEAYFVPWAQRLRAAVDTRIIAVGGMRRTQTMAHVLEAGDADFVAMARPLIREPDLVAQIAAGRTGRVDCTSCNICLMHEDHHTLRCWRTPKRRLAHHALFRLSGGFKR